MPAVDPGYGAWLKAQARFSTAHIIGSDVFGDKAVTSARISPLAYKADADAEAVRQAQFLAGPFAIDTHEVPGEHADLIGQLIILTGDRLGYEAAGATVFVLAADETKGDGTTQLTVLKRL